MFIIQMHDLLKNNPKLEEFLIKHGQKGAKWVLGLSLYLDRVDLQIDYGVPPKQVIRDVVQDFLSNLGRGYGSIESKTKRLPFVASIVEHYADEIIGDVLESTVQYVNDRIKSRSENSSNYREKPTRRVHHSS